MKDIIKKLFENSDKKQLKVKDSATIAIKIEKFNISVTFDKKLNFFEKDYISSISLPDLIIIIENYPIEEIKISLAEYVAYREKLASNDNEKELYKIVYNAHPISITNSTIKFVNSLKIINETLVKSYYFDFEQSSEILNENDLIFEGNVILLLNNIQIEEIDKIISIIKNFEIISIPAFYSNLFNSANFKNLFVPQFVNTNTKVRRLGYLKVFFRFINERKKVPENFMNKKFEEYAAKYNCDLDGNSNNKGIIQIFNGKSADPYILLLKEFDLITTINRIVVPTKSLKTYLALENESYVNDESIFKLKPLDKLFFLETILKKDFLYFSIILEYLNTKVSSYQDIIDKFQELLLQRIKNLIKKNSNNIDNKSISELRIIEKRVIGWKNPKVYLEHIIMPRINWMADLDLISLDDNKYIVSENGKRLNLEIGFWLDLITGYVGNSTDFLKMFYPRIFMESYNELTNNLDFNSIISKIITNFEESFSLFKTLAPNRVTSSQAITYSKYKSCLYNGITISEDEHIKILEENLNDIYIYKYQPAYEDGYIQKINTEK